MKFVLKQSSVLELTIAEDKELHSQMDLRKEEKLKTSFRILGGYSIFKGMAPTCPCRSRYSAQEIFLF